jgi:hypothetical protein
LIVVIDVADATAAAGGADALWLQESSALLPDINLP